jgi:hypothetical protein
MGVEHSLKEELDETRRCPCCKHVSTVKVGEDTPYTSMFAGDFGMYFVCQNPNCNVERIYADNCVMVSGK